MARPKKSHSSASVATAPTAPSSPSNGKSTLPAASVKTYYSHQNGSKKHRGKAPSEKTLLVRAGIAEHPEMMPKALADLLTKNHAGFKFTNQDISQQKLQLRNLKKKGKKKGPKPASVAVAAPTVSTTVSPSPSDIKQLAGLAKKVGTSKIRELCDLIDYVS